MSHKICATLDRVEDVAQYLVSTIGNNAIIFLDGAVGAGKTTLVQQIAKSFGIDDSVTSPTFSLQQCYDNRLFHYDLYRLDSDEFINLGLHEELDRSGWHLIEWGSAKLKEFLEVAGYNTYKVTILPDINGRCYIIGD